MIEIPNKMVADLNERIKMHKANVAASNVFFYTAQLLNSRKKFAILDRDTYREVFLDRLSDIELTTPPTDAFIPGDGKEDEPLFYPNRYAAEYLEITKRVPLHLLEEIFTKTSALMVLIKSDNTKLDDLYDDMFTYYSMFKYLDQIDLLRLDSYSKYTPMIEWIVNNVTYDMWKDYLKKDKIDIDKYASTCEDILFNSDISITHKFYANPETPGPTFDVSNLIQRIATNTSLKSHIHLVLGTFLLLSFAMMDFSNDKVDNSPCADYVTNILSKL